MRFPHPIILHHGRDSLRHAAPSSLDWAEEQRVLKSLFHIRNHALLGPEIHQPPSQTRCLWKLCIVYECYRLFEDHLSEITQTQIPPTPSCWRAPRPRCDERLQGWPNDSNITNHGRLEGFPRPLRTAVGFQVAHVAHGLDCLQQSGHGDLQPSAARFGPCAC